MRTTEPKRRWFQFRLRTLLLAVPFLSAALAVVAMNMRHRANGQPSWFAIGPDVYQEQDVRVAEKQIVSLRIEPRWFVGCDKEVSKAEFDSYFARLGVSAPKQPGGRYYIPNSPPYPKQLDDLPLEDHGVSLGLDASIGDDPAVVLLELKLESKDMPVQRQVEHRWTNTRPFLFAFFVDGQAVVAPSTNFDKEGGADWMAPLVAKGGERKWSVQVRAKSLRALLPDIRPHTLTVAAAFANTQHEGYFPDGNELRGSCETNAELRILVRSRIASLRWDGTKWQGVGP